MLIRAVRGFTAVQVLDGCNCHHLLGVGVEIRHGVEQSPKRVFLRFDDLSSREIAHEIRILRSTLDPWVWAPGVVSPMAWFRTKHHDTRTRRGLSGIEGALALKSLFVATCNRRLVIKVGEISGAGRPHATKWLYVSRHGVPEESGTDKEAGLSETCECGSCVLF